MTKDVAVLSEKEIANIEAEIANKAKELAATLAVTSNRISMKDKEFILPDGRVFAKSADFVVMGWRAQNLHYPGAYDKNNIQSPDCFAAGSDPDNLEPDASIQEPKGATCATCPEGQWDSGLNGKGKACKNTYKVVVRVPGEKALMELSLPPTSMRNFGDAMKTMIAAFGDPVKAISRFEFDPNESYTKIKYGKPSENPNWMQDYQDKMSGSVDKLLDIKPE